MRKLDTTTILLLAAAAGGAIWYFMGSSHRKALTDWATSLPPASGGSAVLAVLPRMTDGEIDQVYDFIFNYYTKGIQVPPGSALQANMLAISGKYSIFT